MAEKEYANAYPRLYKTRSEVLKDKKEYLKKRKAKKESRAENIKSIHPPAHPLSVRGSTEALLGKGNIQEKI